MVLRVDLLCAGTGVPIEVLLVSATYQGKLARQSSRGALIFNLSQFL